MQVKNHEGEPIDPTCRQDAYDRGFQDGTIELRRIQSLYLNQGPIETVEKLRAERDLAEANLASFHRFAHIGSWVGTREDALAWVPEAITNTRTSRVRIVIEEVKDAL